MINRKISSFIGSVLLLLMSLTASASDRTILTLAYKEAGDVVEKHYTFADLSSFEQVSFRTGTPWTSGVNKYEGPRLMDVLNDANMADKEGLLLVGLNDYAAELKSHFAEMAVLTITENDKPMSVRNKGPVWLLFSLDDNPEERVQDNFIQMVWQLASIEER